jgi:hypothetical protein
MFAPCRPTCGPGLAGDPFLYTVSLFNGHYPEGDRGGNGFYVRFTPTSRTIAAIRSMILLSLKGFPCRLRSLG